MPTFRKFLRRFAPRLMGTDGSRTDQYKYGASDYARSSTYGTIQSRLRRQTRQSYAQFDALEMEDFDRAEEVKQGVGLARTTVHVSSPLSNGERVATRNSMRDEASDEGILPGTAIECTRTVDVSTYRR